MVKIVLLSLKITDKLTSMKKIILNSIKAAAIACVLALTSCSSTLVISDSMSAPELIQHGQSEFENGNYKNALLYYNTVIDRYGNDGPSFVEAYYEIGHIYMKQKKYEEAVKTFDEILKIYDSVGYGMLPAAFKKLSQLELAKIPQAEQDKIRAKIAAKTEADKKLAEEAGL